MPVKSKKTLEGKVMTYGFSSESIRVIKKFVTNPDPSRRQVELALKGFARFLLKAESREELKWLSFCDAVVKRHFGSKIQITKPKPCTFKLPANEYTPDFLHILQDGRRVYVEVKGSEFQPNYRDAISKLRMTATLHYYDIFILVMPDKNSSNNGWKVTVIEFDKEYGGILEELASQIDTEKLEQYTGE